jgi:dipeptidyl aminopeptidase/acylaminoacyl peptidase
MLRHYRKLLFNLSLLTILTPTNNQLFAQSSNDFVASKTTRINKGHYSSALQANAASTNASMSDNGRFIAFESTATNLIDESLVTGGLTDGRKHIYLYDRQAGTVEVVSITDEESNTPNVEVPGDATEPAVSNDGRYVAFTTSAVVENVVQVGEMNDDPSKNCSGSGCHVHVAVQGKHVYVRDRLANRTMLVSQVTTSAVSQTEENGVLQTVDEDSTNTATVDVIPIFSDVGYPVRVSAAIRPSGGWKKSELLSASSSNPRFSADGKYIIFETTANNLAVSSSGEGESACDPFYRVPPLGLDVTTGGVVRNPLTQAILNAIPANPEDYIRNRINTSNTAGPGNGLVVGEYLYSGATLFIEQGCYSDSNSVKDAIIRHGESNTNSMVSMFCKFFEPGEKCVAIAATSDVEDPDISSDASYVTFSSKTPFLESDFNKTDDVYIVERDNIIGNGGEQVVEEISNLYRISNNRTKITSANGASTNPTISGDGRFVAYQSAATDIINGDTNGKSDIYLYDRKFGDHVICSKSSAGTLSNGDSGQASISSDGTYITFHSNATNLGISSGTNNVYLANVILDSDGSGRLVNCYVSSTASYGTGTGGNGASTNAEVGIALKTELASNGDTVRVKHATISYETLASNLAKDTDTNGVSDILQTPDCTASDLTNDNDGDGTVDCFDQCWKDATKVQDIDSDGDGVADCEDGCVSDSLKTGPQICGCGIAETDVDKDGTPDCQDSCPTDPQKVAEGSCGCGVPDLDLDDDGVIDCVESNPPVPGQTPTVTPTPAGTSAGGTPTPVATSNELPLPSIVTVRINKQRQKARVVVASTAAIGEGVYKYDFRLRSVGTRSNRQSGRKNNRNGDTKAQISSTSQTTFSGLDVGQRYAVKYRLISDSKTTEFSPEKIFRVRAK